MGYVYGRRTWRGLAGVTFRALVLTVAVVDLGDRDMDPTDENIRLVAESVAILASAERWSRRLFN